MLTRIEIDGFKTFENFTLDLAPLMVILGPNASGKSNLFDVIQLLSKLASTDLREAVNNLRGEADDLFRIATPGEAATKIHFAVEVLVDPVVRDFWGTEVELKHTRIRYEVTIHRHIDERGVERLLVSHEEARPILAKEDRWRQTGHVSNAFRNAYLKYLSRRSAWLSTHREGGQVIFRTHQDGRAGKTGSILPASAAQATVLSSITTSEFAHLFALREEMRPWRFLQLDPASLRRPSPVIAPDVLRPDGANLATVLARIKAETADETQPKGVVSDITAELAGLIPGVIDIDVKEDRSAREYRIDVTMRDGIPFSSRVISDGTLRVLSLLTMLYDPRHRGLVCFEEPENGIHPARLRELMKCLSHLVSHLQTDYVEPGEPLSQLLMNSHSPVVLSALQSGITNGKVVFADLVTVIDPQTGIKRRKTRIRPIEPKDQGSLLTHATDDVVTRFEVEKYLKTADQEEWA